MSEQPAIRPVEPTTDDGLTLEAELAAPADVRAALVMCHPHPLYGGNMFNNVVGAVFDALPRSGVAVLRFNFRGTGRSEGSHGDGVGERHDVAAALDALAEAAPGVPLVLGGYSFGADVSLAVADERMAAWFAVAPPLRVVAVEDMVAGADPRPKRLVTGEHDEFRPPDEAEAAVADWADTRVTSAAGASHFFATGLEVVVDEARALVDELTASG